VSCGQHTERVNGSTWNVLWEIILNPYALIIEDVLRISLILSTKGKGLGILAKLAAGPEQVIDSENPTIITKARRGEEGTVE
jgi:hypothetical protein